MSNLVCNSCGSNLGESSDETEKIMKCPLCGSEKLVYMFALNDRMEFHENIKGKSDKIPGKKKPATEFRAGQEKCVSQDKWVNKERVIDRENNEYYEKVSDPTTGNIIHECSEPLSEHFGHGSAKNKKQ